MMKNILILFMIVPFLSTARVVEKIEALVDDQMIALSELQGYRKLLSSKIPYTSELFKIRSKKSLMKNKKLLLNHMIDERVLWNALPVQRRELVSSEEVLQSFLKKSNFTQKKLMRELNKIGMPLDQYKEILLRNQAYQEWIQAEIVASIQITAQEMNDDYFQKNKTNLFKKYKYEFRQWTFDLSQEGKDQAQKFLKDPEDIKFEDQNLTSSQMNPSLRKALLSLSLGQFSEVTCFSQNCYVFKLLSKSFLVEENRKTNRIRTRLFNQVFLTQLQSWVQSHRENALIKKYL